MKIDIKIPAVGESVNSAVIGSWQKSHGDYVERDEVLVLLETDKASVEVPAEHSGKLSISAKEGEELSVGSVIGSIDTSAKKPQESPSKASDVIEKKPSSNTASSSDSSHLEKNLQKKAPFDPSQFSPSVRRVLEEKNLDPKNMSGSGKKGRLTKSDILSSLEENKKSSPSDLEAPSKVKEFSGDQPVLREKMTVIRKRIAERLVESQKTTASLTTFNEVDMTRILDLRKNYQEVFQKKYGIKLGFMSFFIKAVIQAMKIYPRVGAQIEGEELVYHKHSHISVAVSTEKGLLVPVIHYADQMSISDLEKAVLHFAKKAREGKISPDDLSGGTFTLSNGGVFGSLLSTPILNPPQSGILGMHKMEKRPVVIGSEIVIRPMMYLAFTYDHRIIDGKESVGFLLAVKEFIEEPARILLDI